MRRQNKLMTNSFSDTKLVTIDSISETKDLSDNGFGVSARIGR